MNAEKIKQLTKELEEVSTRISAAQKNFNAEVDAASRKFREINDLEIPNDTPGLDDIRELVENIAYDADLVNEDGDRCLSDDNDPFHIDTLWENSYC